MNKSFFEQIQCSAEFLNLDLSAQEMAQLSMQYAMDEETVRAVAEVFTYLKDKRSTSIITTLLRLSRLPLKEPKTFESFDFTQLHGKNVDALKLLPSLSAVYAHKNLAFIGPRESGKPILPWHMGGNAATED